MMKGLIMKIDTKKKCCACWACVNVCPTNAITMVGDEYGFLFPSINKNICISCNSCEQVCQIDAPVTGSVPSEVYALICMDKGLLARSSSGGAFGVLAKSILQNGGAVIGCAFSDNFQVKHVVINETEQLDTLHGSKYVQSEIGNVLSIAKSLLDNDRQVLFSGTPCQIAGLKKYLSHDYEKLITVDLICHGTPSQKLFDDYITYLNKENKGLVTKYRFRAKKRNSNFIGYADILKKNGTITRKDIYWQTDPYNFLFMYGKTYRENCYSCAYANIKRIGDITIGDYWGAESLGVPIDASAGVSLLTVNSDRGKQLFDTVSSEISKYTSSIEHAAKHNGQLTKPYEKPAEREQILKLWADRGFPALAEYVSLHNMKEVRQLKTEKIIQLIPRDVRKLLKRIVGSNH